MYRVGASQWENSGGWVTEWVCGWLWRELNNKAVIYPWSPLLWFERRQCVIVFFVTKGYL